MDKNEIMRAIELYSATVEKAEELKTDVNSVIDTVIMEKRKERESEAKTILYDALEKASAIVGYPKAKQLVRIVLREVEEM